MNNISSFRGAIGSVLGTVSNTASAITNLVGATNSGINMLDSFVQTAATKQRMDNALDLSSYETTALNRVGMELANQEMEILVYRKQSTEHDTAFTNAYNRLYEVLHPKTDAKNVVQIAEAA